MGLESPNILKWAEQWESQCGHLPIARNWDFRHCKVGPKAFGFDPFLLPSSSFFPVYNHPADGVSAHSFPG